MLSNSLKVHYVPEDLRLNYLKIYKNQQQFKINSLAYFLEFFCPEP